MNNLSLKVNSVQVRITEAPEKIWLTVSPLFYSKHVEGVLKFPAFVNRGDCSPSLGTEPRIHSQLRGPCHNKDTHTHGVGHSHGDRYPKSWHPYCDNAPFPKAGICRKEILSNLYPARAYFKCILITKGRVECMHITSKEMVHITMFAIFSEQWLHTSTHQFAWLFLRTQKEEDADMPPGWNDPRDPAIHWTVYYFDLTLNILNCNNLSFTLVLLYLFVVHSRVNICLTLSVKQEIPHVNSL